MPKKQPSFSERCAQMTEQTVPGEPPESMKEIVRQLLEKKV